MPATPSTTETPTPGFFRPRLTLQTLTRGDGLLGMRGMDGFGPRSTQLTVARVDWTYETAAGLHWETPAPTRVLNTRPKPTELLRGAWNERVLLLRDLAAEADARDAAVGQRPAARCRPQALQWRRPEAAEGHDVALERWPRRRTSATSGPSRCRKPAGRAAGSIVVRRGLRARERAGADRWTPRHRRRGGRRNRGAKPSNSAYAGAEGAAFRRAAPAAPRGLVDAEPRRRGRR